MLEGIGLIEEPQNAVRPTLPGHRMVAALAFLAFVIIKLIVPSLMQLALLDQDTPLAGCDIVGP